MNSLWKRLLIAAVVVMVIMPIARSYFGRASEPSDVPSAKERFSAVGADTQVIVAKQDAEGVSEEQLTTDAANKLGDYSLERMRFHTAKILTQMNSKESADSITADTVLLNVENRNLVVTRFHLASKVPYIQFLGIDGNEMTRVLCMAAPTEDVMIAGKCSDKLKEQFGVSMEALGIDNNG